jgi:hypothetical protein
VDGRGTYCRRKLQDCIKMFPKPRVRNSGILLNEVNMKRRRRKRRRRKRRRRRRRRRGGKEEEAREN